MDAAVSYLGGVGVWPVVLVVLGVVLLIVEMFVPGFGIPGVAGAISSIAGIILWARTWEEALIVSACVIVVLLTALMLVVRSAQKGRLARSKFILNESMRFGAGYAEDFSEEKLLGRTGTAVSELRPAGIGLFDGKRIDVVSDGEFIPRGSAITILRLEGRRIIVGRAAGAEGKEGE